MWSNSKFPIDWIANDMRMRMNLFMRASMRFVYTGFFPAICIIPAGAHSFCMHLMCHFHLPLICHIITSHFRFYLFSTCWLTILSMLSFYPLFVLFFFCSSLAFIRFRRTHTHNLVLVLILNYLLLDFIHAIVNISLCLSCCVCCFCQSPFFIWLQTFSRFCSLSLGVWNRALSWDLLAGWRPNI